MCARRGSERPAPQPVATALVAELPAVSAGAIKPSIRPAGMSDRARAGIDQDARPIPERRCQRDFGIAAHVDPVGSARGLNRVRESFLFRGTTRSGRADERQGGRQRDVGLRGRPPRDVEDYRRRALGSAGSHRGARTFGAAEHSTLAIANGDGGMGAATVDAEKDGRMGGWVDGPLDHVAPPICPPAHRPDTSDEIIPTATVTAVPSGTYHGHARPGSQCTGKCGMTAPSTTGDMTAMLTTRATMTST